MELFKDWLRARMKEQGLSGRGLASYAHVSGASLSNYLVGGLPEEGNARRLAIYFHTDPQEVWNMVVAERTDREREKLTMALGSPAPSPAGMTYRDLGDVRYPRTTAEALEQWGPLLRQIAEVFTSLAQRPGLEVEGRQGERHVAEGSGITYEPSLKGERRLDETEQQAGERAQLIQEIVDFYMPLPTERLRALAERLREQSSPVHEQRPAGLPPVAAPIPRTASS